MLSLWGEGRTPGAVKRLLGGLGLPIVWVDEFETSRLARALYFNDHPPRGWRRLIPLGLQLPAAAGGRLRGHRDRPPVLREGSGTPAQR